MAYHMLFTRNDKHGWGPQFGDHVRSVVVEESKDSYRDVPAADRVILKLPNASQSHCDNAVASLNKYGKNIRCA